MFNLRLSLLTASVLAAGALGCGGSIDISPLSLPNAVQGQPFSAQLVGTGAQPVTWAITKGALPTGITLNAKNGLLAGTPTVFGSFAFTIKGTDNSTFASNVGTESYTLVVIQTLSITSTLPDATAGSPYEGTLTAVGGVPPYAFTVVGLHAGLSLESATITGTPPLETTYTVTITVTDSGTPQQTVSAMQTLLIRPPNVTITTSALPTGHVGEPYQAVITTADGSGNFVWAVSNGLLPSGLSLDTTTGVISGTPTTPGTTAISISVTDNGSPGVSATQTFDLVVVSYATLQINTSSCPDGTVGTAYSCTIMAVGGTGTVVFSLDTSDLADGGVSPYVALPMDLTLDSQTGVISGTPTTAATTSFEIEATDGASPPDEAFHAYTVTIGS